MVMAVRRLWPEINGARDEEPTTKNTLEAILLKNLDWFSRATTQSPISIQTHYLLIQFSSHRWPQPQPQPQPACQDYCLSYRISSCWLTYGQHTISTCC